MSEGIAGMSQVIKIDEARIQDHLGQVVPARSRRL